MPDTPFAKFHRDAGATLIERHGWLLPDHYGDALVEHAQCRSSGGIFDVSHLGRLRLSGRHARKLLERALTRKITDMPLKTCRLAVVCREDGSTLDVVTAYRFDKEWLVVTNAAQRAAVADHFAGLIDAESFSVKLDDETTKTAMLSVQGPKVVDKIGEFSREIPTLKPWAFALKNLLILKMIVSRTGYTGGDGVEVLLGANMASMAIKLLLKDKSEAAAIQPAGMQARESLRVEAGLPAAGTEFGGDDAPDPLTLGLHRAVDLHKHEVGDDDVPVPRFVGQAALEKIAAERPTRKLVSFTTAGDPPAVGSAVTAGGRAVGSVTSTARLPEGSAALALVAADAAGPFDA